MILLSCAKMPDGLDKNTLASAVGLMFPHKDNMEYIAGIKCRKNDASACESLFVLALLYEKICELPSYISVAELVFAKSDSGKPYFKDSKVKFNISHSRGYVACAVSIDEEVGVDIEATKLTNEKAQKLAKRYFSEKEINTVSNDPDAFAKLWSEKEAEAKFYGKSVGIILSDLQNSTNSSHNSNIVLHKFKFGNIPITLCTKRDFSTIIFSAQH